MYWSKIKVGDKIKEVTQHGVTYTITVVRLFTRKGVKMYSYTSESFYGKTDKIFTSELPKGKLSEYETLITT